MVCQGGNVLQYLSVAILTFVSSLRTCSDNKCLQVNDGGRVKNQNIESGWPEYHLQLKLIDPHGDVVPGTLTQNDMVLRRVVDWTCMIHLKKTGFRGL